MRVPRKLKKKFKRINSQLAAMREPWRVALVPSAAKDKDTVLRWDLSQQEIRSLFGAGPIDIAP